MRIYLSWFEAFAIAVTLLTFGGCSGSSGGATPPQIDNKSSGQLTVRPSTMSLSSSGAQTVTVSAAVSETLSAASSNTSVAIVTPATATTRMDTGGVASATFTVTPVTPGTATITITDRNGNNARVATTVVKPGGENLYVTIFDPVAFTSMIVAYPPNAIGSAKPIGTINGVGGNAKFGIDSEFRLYAATATPSVDVFASICAPITKLGTLTIPDQGAPGEVAIGPTGEIFVGTTHEFGIIPSTQHLFVFPPGSVGVIKPSRDLFIPKPISIAVDSQGFLYILPLTAHFEADRILIYSPTADGEATPVRTITRPNFDLTAIAVDSSGRIYTAGNTGGLVYAANASGNATPIAEIPVQEGVAYRSVTVSRSGVIYFGPQPTAETGPADILEYSLTNTAPGFRFIGTLHTGVNRAEASALVAGP